VNEIFFVDGLYKFPIPVYSSSSILIFKVLVSMLEEIDGNATPAIQNGLGEKEVSYLILE